MWRSIVTLAALAGGLVLVAAGLGCSKTTNAVRGNLRPTVRLTQAPVDSGEVDSQGDRVRYFYAYRMDWSGYDPDGRVDHYLYAIDPPDDGQVAAGQDTAWVLTTNNEEVIFFQSTTPDPGETSNQSSDPHTFVIKAIDNRGAASEPVARAFYSYTVAPTVNIVSPLLSRDVNRIISPSVRITWDGTDVDGQFTQKPVRYLYRLFTDLGGTQNDPESDLSRFAEQNPRAFRDSMIHAGFPGFRSTPAESAFAQYTDLPPSVTGTGTGRSTRSYLFIVVAIDEAGAYSADMSRNSNMLKLSVGFFGALGPTFTVFNQFIQFQYPGAGFGYDDRNCSLLDVEVPSDLAITWNWFATATDGASIRGYRWALDLDDPFDETARTNEETDYYHWSQFDPGVTFCNLPAFGPGRHELKVEALDNNGLKSSACIRFSVIAPSFDTSDPAARVLIVDDTRLEPDKFNGRTAADTIPRAYAISFPSATEFDTLLFAVGGVPIRRLQANRPPATSLPGVFQGFRFDTLGTRQGLENVAVTVPLSKLFQYASVVWLTDFRGASYSSTGLDRVSPITTLRYISNPGRPNVVSTYFGAGGRLWLAGGGIAEASTRPWRGLPGRPVQIITEGVLYRYLEDGRGELGPGRMMYDVAGWQVEFVSGGTQIRPIRWDPLVPRTYPGAPDRSALPAAMRVRAQGAVPPEELPARRDEFDYFYNEFNGLAAEYLSARTLVVDENDVPVLDTLMVFDRNYGLLRQDSGSPSWVVPCMTYYHPGVGGTCLTTGFAPWDFLREDQIALVNFVFQGVWHLSHGSNPYLSRSPVRPLAAPARPILLTPAQRGERAGLPTLPSGGHR